VTYAALSDRRIAIKKDKTKTKKGEKEEGGKPEQEDGISLILC